MNEDTNREILIELRKLRQLTQWSLGLAMLAFALLGVYYGYARQELYRSRFARDVETLQRQQTQQASTDAGDPWTLSQSALDRGDNEKALSIAKSYVARQPNNHYAYATLGSVYVALNDFTNAEAAYVRAIALFPAEEHEKMLAAIRKRLARERDGQPQSK